MKKWLQEILVCPECLPRQSPLTLEIREAQRDDVTEGRLNCPACGAAYDIRQGIAEILPRATKTALTNGSGYNSKNMLSAYLWSHFGDLTKDPDATDAYQQWVSHIKPAQGLALDIGCAVGRVSFEMSTSHRKVVGIDTSRSFIENARDLLDSDKMGFDLIVEGRITERREFALDADWNNDRIEFIVADAMALPFQKQLFSTISSINVLEKVPDPLQHISEVNRVLMEKDAQFAFSDPFSWDEAVSPTELWIGGKTEGTYPGRGMNVMRRLFQGENGIINPSLEITESGTVSWKIRKTENLWEHIRSQFIVGVR